VRTGQTQHLVACAGVFALFVASASGVSAQTATPAPDGQLFQNQSTRTRNDFAATFGAACAEREWVWQHSLVVDSAILDGPPASDGQSLASQDDDVQLAFVALFGPQATREWDAEHEAVVAHRVLLEAVAPVLCPPARAVSAPSAIGTTHLQDAVDAAKDNKVGDAFVGFDAFKAVWSGARSHVTQQAPDVARDVQAAVDQVNALLGDPKAPPPPQSQYYPALQNLLKVVRTANAALANGN
jgi:hypothetical protein